VLSHFAALLVVSDPGPKCPVNDGDGDSVIQHLLAGVPEDDGGHFLQGDGVAAVGCCVEAQPVLQ